MLNPQEKIVRPVEGFRFDRRCPSNTEVHAGVEMDKAHGPVESAATAFIPVVLVVDELRVLDGEVPDVEHGVGPL